MWKVKQEMTKACAPDHVLHKAREQRGDLVTIEQLHCARRVKVKEHEAVGVAVDRGEHVVGRAASDRRGWRARLLHVLGAALVVERVGALHRVAGTRENSGGDGRKETRQRMSRDTRARIQRVFKRSNRDAPVAVCC